MRLKLLVCEILFRESCHLMASSHNMIDVEFLSKGLHDLGRKGMSSRLREAVAAVDTSQYEAILLGYALCSGGIVGLEAPEIPLVVPKAHDCITLFLGDRGRYLEYFNVNPGTYFKTSGWIERGGDLVQISSDSMNLGGGRRFSFPEMVDRYGEDNARYLWDQLSRMQNYSKLAFIETGIEPSDEFEKESERLAEEKNWEFEKLKGDLGLLRRLIDGPWDEDFLVVNPGERIEFEYGDEIIRTIKSPPASAKS